MTGSAGPATIPANTEEIALNSAVISAFGFTLSGSVYAKASNGTYSITIPESDPLTLSFLDFGNLTAYGYIDSDGSFSFSVTAGFDRTVGPFELYGSVGATISNAGFSASFDGGANINIGASTINIASASGYFAIDGTQLDLDASVSIAGISYSFSASLGTAPTPPSDTPGLQVYSVPTFAGAGQQIELSAAYYATNGSNYAPVDYMWVISSAGSPTQTISGDPVSVTLGGPGTYSVSLDMMQYDAFGNILHQIPAKQSTITVVDIPPTISTLGLNAAYPTGQAFVFGGNINAVNYSTLQYNWTVLRNGATLRPATPMTLISRRSHRRHSA